MNIIFYSIIRFLLTGIIFQIPHFEPVQHQSELLQKLQCQESSQCLDQKSYVEFNDLIIHEHSDNSYLHKIT